MSSAPDFSRAIALYGGSFDPPHLGHMQVANSVLSQFTFLHQLCFVPAGLSPGKPAPRAAGDLRSHWLRALLQPHDKCTVWDYEWQKSGPSFTVETLEEARRLGATKNNLYFVLGEDSYRNFMTWKATQRIRELAQLIVVSRTGAPLKALRDDDKLLPCPAHPASSSQLRLQLAKNDFSSKHLPRVVQKELEILALQGKNPYANS